MLKFNIKNIVISKLYLVIKLYRNSWTLGVKGVKILIKRSSKQKIISINNKNV